MGDNVTFHEIGIIKDFTEDAFRKQVLDKHLLNGLNGDIGVDALLAKLDKIIERLNENSVGLAFFLNELEQPGSQVTYFKFEFFDGLLELLEGRFFISKEKP